MSAKIVDAQQALAAGITGGLAMSLVGIAARSSGVALNLEMLVGTLVLPPGAAASIAGFCALLAASAAIGLVYALAFQRVARRAGPLIGALFSLAHVAAASALMMAVPGIHPRAELLAGLGAWWVPGQFRSGAGLASAGCFVLAHLAYGATVGAVYAALGGPRSAAPSATSASGRRPLARGA